MDDALNPLNDQHLADINLAIANAEKAMQALAKAKLAHIDTGDNEAKLTDALARLRAIKQVYFPGR